MMRLILALSAALAVSTVTASAQTEEREERTRLFVHHAGGHANMDADGDGWISRAESSAAADRIFGELDRNDDGRLDEADRPEVRGFQWDSDVPAPEAGDGDDNCTRTESGEGEDRRVTIVCRSARVVREGQGEDREVRRHVFRHRDGDDDDDNCERAETGEGENRRVTVICRGEARAEGDVVIHRLGEGHGEVMIAPMAPHAPVAAHAPVFMMFLDEDSEADLNGDGAISQDEFRAQHLRMFDARDANGDGRVRAHRMPGPPRAPAPPAPPALPRRE